MKMNCGGVSLAGTAYADIVYRWAIFEVVFGFFCVVAGIAEVIVFPGQTYFQAIWGGAGIMAAGLFGIWAYIKKPFQNMFDIFVAFSVLGILLGAAVLALNIMTTLFIYVLITDALAILFCFIAAMHGVFSRPGGACEEHCLKFSQCVVQRSQRRRR